MTKRSTIGMGPTGLVAIERHYPESVRIINDDLAFRILPYSLRLQVIRKLLSTPCWF